MELPNDSPRDLLLSLPPEQRDQFLLALPPEEALAAEYSWSFWARTDQLIPPGDWFVWLILAGRGWG